MNIGRSGLGSVYSEPWVEGLFTQIPGRAQKSPAEAGLMLSISMRLESIPNRGQPVRRCALNQRGLTVIATEVT
jgi:hypothetical protein